MALKTSEITIDGEVFEVKEQTVRVLMPLMEADSTNLGLELAKVCVYRGDTPIGDAVLDMGMSDFQRILEHVNEVHGMGNDPSD